MFLRETGTGVENGAALEATGGPGAQLMVVQIAMITMVHLCTGMIGAAILHAALIPTGLVLLVGETLAALRQEATTIDRGVLQEEVSLKREDLVDTVTPSDIRRHHLRTIGFRRDRRQIDTFHHLVTKKIPTLSHHGIARRNPLVVELPLQGKVMQCSLLSPPFSRTHNNI
jgi:hypothetical protein